VTGTLAKIATDVKLMMQTEVEEVYEPFHEGPAARSSTMPAESANPIASLYITATSGMVRQLVAALLNRHGPGPRSAPTGTWEIEWIAMPEIFLLAAGRRSISRGSLSRALQVNPERMRANLDITRGLIVSEAVMMGPRTVARAARRAHDLVYDVCRQGDRH